MDSLGSYEAGDLVLVWMAARGLCSAETNRGSLQTEQAAEL